MTYRLRAPALGLALVLAVTLSVSIGPLPAGSSPARQSHGAAGAGDPYFPRDGNGGIDVLHYDIRDRYAFRSGRLTGRTALVVRATKRLTRFNLDFLLGVGSVRVDGQRARFRQAGDHELRIRPRTPIPAEGRFRVVVRYAGVPAREASQGERNWLADDREVVTMNQPHMATWWFPSNDHPSDKASYDIRITAPRGKDVIANGVLVGKRVRGGRATTHWRAVEPMASYLAFFAAGPFRTRSASCQGLPNYVAVSRQDTDRDSPVARESARDLAAKTCQVLTAFAAVLGPYPFSATGGVVTALPVGFALENQTRPTYPALSGPRTSLVAHEVAHQWFGDSVSVSGWRDIWLNEGFATFLENYYVTEVLQRRSMQDWLVAAYDSRPPGDDFWGVSIGNPGPRRLFHGAVYVRGAMAVQALRHRIGDTAFWALLRTWLAQRQHGNGSVAEFEALAASVSGQDLAAFFDAWLRTRTAPARTAANGF